MSHIAILVHQHDPYDRVRYFMREIADVWRESGMRVTVCRGLGPHVEADLAIVHVDLTIVPDEYLQAARSWPRVLNAGVIDVSKRRFSTNLVTRGDDCDGPVIVKTDRNYGGRMEANLPESGSGPRRLLRRVVSRLSWKWCSVLTSSNYPVFESVRDVPEAVWANPALIVERFLVERRDDCSCLRTWVFLGDKETNSLSYSRHAIVKADNVVRREVVADVPDELRRIRQKMGFDFGKFDYAIVDGRVVLYDVNRTPALGTFFTPDQFMPRIRLLAEGIKAYF